MPNLSDEKAFELGIDVLTEIFFYYGIQVVLVWFSIKKLNARRKRMDKRLNLLES